MKNHWKTTTFVLVTALAVGFGTDFVSGQSSTTTTPAVSGTAPGPRGGARGARGAAATPEEEPLPGQFRRQPHMDAAWRALRRARVELDLAEADKGGFREKAIKSIDVAINDVKDGIIYSDEHPEEFGRGGRGPRGARGPATTSTAPSTTAK